MTTRPIGHPSPDALRALAAGRLDGAAGKAVLAHLEACPECCLAVTTFGPAAAGAPEAIPPELRDHAEFEVLRKLGGGGMGVVYLARDRLTHRQEVLKVVNPHLATQPGVAERFLREIRAVVQLLHPNIVTAYGALQVGGLLVLKMEYVPGDDLNTVVKTGGPLLVVNACYYAQQVAVGLQYAFGKGMIHRDVKPGNLMLAREGKKHTVKLLDFGLAKVTAAQGGAGDHLTMTAQGMGTPAYMAPEQVKDAARADIRADIYSLGCTLYFLLTGRPPFSGLGPYDLWEAHRTKTAPSLNEVRKDVPTGLAEVVAKMLAKAPARRYQEPVEVAQALKPFVKTVLKPLPVPPPVAGKRGQTEPVKPVAIPVAVIERQDTSDRTMKAPPRKGSEEGRRAGPAIKPATNPKGGTLAVILGVAGLLLFGCGAVYWAVSGPGGRGDSSPGEFAHPDKGRIPPPSDVVARVKDVSGIELVSIPSGSFYMGSPTDDKDARDNEKPQHKVTISQPFYLGKFHVTVGQFRRFVDVTGHETEAEKEGDKWTWKKPGFPDHGFDRGFDQTDEHPVVCVSWNDANAFCQWLAKETGAKVRLPYEAEWEYSCRAVTEAKKPTTKFYFGDDMTKLGYYAGYSGNSDNTTHPCGQKTPNDFGLYDMHGLAWEWCADCTRTYEDQAETDPKGPAALGSRINRGGSFRNDPWSCRAAYRGSGDPWGRGGDVGFRVLVSR